MPSFTELGTAVAPGPGTVVGAGLDVASLIASGVGEAQASEEEQRRWEKQFGLTKGQVIYQRDRENRDLARKEAFNAALRRAFGGGA